MSRGIPPALAESSLIRGLELMQQWSGGEICSGLVDAYPLKAQPVQVSVSEADVRRLLGIELTCSGNCRFAGEVGIQMQRSGRYSPGDSTGISDGYRRRNDRQGRYSGRNSPLVWL